MPYTKRNWIWHLLVDGIDYGFWAGKEGGESDSDGDIYPDWDGDVTLGGKPTRGDITLKKLYREQVHAQFRDLDSRTATGKFVLTGTPTGDDGVAWGNPIVYTGTLKGVKPPDTDKGSSDGGELELTLKPDTRLA
jgi:hypothetical protein